MELSESLLNEIKEEVDQKLKQNSKDWRADRFTPAHSLPYIYTSVIAGKIKGYEM